jgi:hypothetical protein
VLPDLLLLGALDLHLPAGDALNRIRLERRAAWLS